MLFRITKSAVVVTFIKRNPLCNEINQEGVALVLLIHGILRKRQHSITEVANVKAPVASFYYRCDVQQEIFYSVELGMLASSEPTSEASKRYIYVCTVHNQCVRC